MNGYVRVTRARVRLVTLGTRDTTRELESECARVMFDVCTCECTSARVYTQTRTHTRHFDVAEDYRCPSRVSNGCSPLT